MTDYVRPESLDAALQARAAHPRFVVLAGGTDLLVNAIERPEPEGIVDVFGLTELVGVREDGAGVRIGAATTYAEILASSIVRERLPMLRAAAREVGALQIQARGTLGGNIATSSPVGDTLPVLLALDATIEVASEARGSRAVPYESFCTGYRKTALAPDELIVSVRFEGPRSGARQLWRKIGTRRAQSISKVMIAAHVVVGSGGTIDEARLGLGAVRDRPIRARAVEAALGGERPGPELEGRVREAIARDISPIDDVRSTASYRSTVAGNVLCRFVSSLATDAARR